jgi:hypothetical protein
MPITRSWLQEENFSCVSQQYYGYIDKEQTVSRPDQSILRPTKEVPSSSGWLFLSLCRTAKTKIRGEGEFANHPLFAMLLEDAESEYGYSSEGPLLLPCDVDLFNRVLAEMDGSDEMISTPGCSLGKGYGSLIFPRRTPAHSPDFSISKSGYGAYRILRSPLQGMNQL